MMVKRALVLSLVLCAPLAARADRVVEKVVAVVNDEIILQSELEQWAAPQLQQRGALDLDSSAGKKAFDDVKRETLEKLIDSRLVLQQAGELKLAVSNDEVERALDEVKKQNKLDDATFAEALKQQGFTLDSYKKNLKRQILELKVINTAVRSRVQVSDDEVKTYYLQNAKQLNGQGSAHLRQILIGVAADASADEVERRRKTAEKMVSLTREGKSFVELAKQYSDDELTKSEGGDLGEIGPGVLQDALDEVVRNMEPGDVRGPIRTARGWHVIQLVERSSSNVLPFEQVKEQLRKQLYDQQVEKTSTSWIKELRKKAHVDVRL